MFCYQCQEAMKGTGCNAQRGMCGKETSTSDLQDLLIYTAKGVAVYSSQLTNSKHYKESYFYLLNALFITITNANFDDKAIVVEIKKGLVLRETLKQELLESKVALSPKHEGKLFTTFGANDLNAIDKMIEKAGILATANEDIRSLRSLLIFGLKGLAAYTEHALHLGKTDNDLIRFVEKVLLSTEDETLDADTLTALVVECGSMGVKAMALLDSANTETFGNPEISTVELGVGDKPGILVSGHDLEDLRQLLEQSEGSGVDIYTHSEMLPAHYYPKLKKFSHLKGNYGNAWHAQKTEFETFNGPILFTTNCIVPPTPSASYKNRVFTTNASGFPNWKHIVADSTGKKDFSEIIALAKTCKAPTSIETGTIVGGFAHHQTLALADKVLDAVKSGAIKNFIVMGGCDGRNKEREYYTDFAKNLPKDSVILTAGCAKYRYNKLSLGDINGIPRLLDAGQCNDSYSLALIALSLQKALNLSDINDLPITYNIAWYEQKAVIVLLALLSLGVKNIHLGPTLPAFLSPNVANILVSTFGIGLPSLDATADIKKWQLA